MTASGSTRADFTGVRSTMLVTLYLRAEDSRSERPVLGDRIAAETMERIEYDTSWLALTKSNQALVARRARILDEWTTAFLDQHPEAVVLQLACGLDSRAFRVHRPEGSRWYDVDFPDVVELRRKVYDEPDGYHVIGASVTDAGWLDQVPSGVPALVIAEGLTMYLERTDLAAMFARLGDHFAGGEMIFDVVAPWVSRTTQLIPEPLRFGYPAYASGFDDPREIESWHDRLRLREVEPLIADDAGIPHPLQRGLYRALGSLPLLRDGIRNVRFRF